MSLWRSLLPVICKVQGYAIAGGTDIAFCADLLMIAEDAKLGYPPARVWGCPPGAMWVYRLGAERAKRLLLTGDLIDGNKLSGIDNGPGGGETCFKDGFHSPKLVGHAEDDGESIP